jgi:glycerol-3-phosphate dehydrogenase
MAEAAEYDAIIIGAGINGCGTFRDLALQGLRVLLLERGDICQGASAASSRLMHGGLKYLETGEFRLVRESLTERNMLLSTAPHYVHPLECVVPVTSTWGGIAGSIARFFRIKARINDRGYVITGLGLALYDLYGRALRTMPKHRMLRRERLRRLMPDLAAPISGAGIYYEGQITHAERLGLELVLDAEAANTAARCETHVTVTGSANGTLTYCRASGESVTANAPVIVNAGGAWIDRVNATLGIDSRLMGGSRGSHLIVANAALFHALGGRMIYFGTPDGRVNLVYPFQDRVMIGSTDIPQPDPDTATCTAEEEAYLRAAVATVFPDIPVTPDQIVARFSGTRPLPRADGDIGLVTRDHSIVTLSLPGSAVPVHCLIGGKWTTFRAFSELAADRVLADLCLPRKVSTKGLPIGGGRDYPSNAAERARLLHAIAQSGHIPTDRAETLLARYGTRALTYADTLRGKGETMLTTLPDYAAEELRHIAATEKVATIDDLVHRRTLIAMTGRDSPAARAEIAAWLTDLPHRASA